MRPTAHIGRTRKSLTKNPQDECRRKDRIVAIISKIVNDRCSCRTDNLFSNFIWNQSIGVKRSLIEYDPSSWDSIDNTWSPWINSNPRIQANTRPWNTADHELSESRVDECRMIAIYQGSYDRGLHRNEIGNGNGILWTWHKRKQYRSYSVSSLSKIVREWEN